MPIPYTCQTCSTHTSGIGVDGYGQVWFDDSEQDMFGSFPDSGTGSFSVYPAPTQNAHPHDGLNVDAHNRIWFTEEFANKLAEAVQTTVPTPTPSPCGFHLRRTRSGGPIRHCGEQLPMVRPGEEMPIPAAPSRSSTPRARSPMGAGPTMRVLGPTATDADVLFSWVNQ